ncbi:response regulator transcription factor [Candidatus Desantisbacteria bacterium]|nr:response regulator transcription factor [Candidatus Desantisbacteria bacterium]
MDTQLKIIIIENDIILLEKLNLILSGEPGIEVAGIFNSTDKAMSLIEKISPDIVLTELSFPDISGIELIKNIKNKIPDSQILIYTNIDEGENIFSALKAGVSGYILKGSSAKEIIESIYSLYQGGVPMSPKIARKVILEFQKNSAPEAYILTQRKKDILKFIDQGYSYKEISNKLQISTNTVHTHIKYIYDKLQAKDRHEALHIAKRKGLI